MRLDVGRGEVMLIVCDAWLVMMRHDSIFTKVGLIS